MPAEPCQNYSVDRAESIPAESTEIDEINCENLNSNLSDQTEPNLYGCLRQDLSNRHQSPSNSLVSRYHHQMSY